MLSEEQLEALGARYKSTGGVGSLVWKGHQFVFRHPNIDEWDNYTRSKKVEASGAPDRQITQMLIVSFDGETDIGKARQAYGAFLAAGNAGFPNAPQTNALLSHLAGTVTEEDLAQMGEAVRLWTGIPRDLPGASRNGSLTVPAGPSFPTTEGLPPSLRPNS
jgi:hypothetical protein